MATSVAQPPATAYSSNPAADLSEEQEGKRLKVLEHFSNDYKIPGTATENSSLSEDEKFWLTNDAFLRYLRASKWVTETAISRLEDTLRWRREYGFYTLLTPEYVEPEALTGKEILAGYDCNGRPSLYMLPSRQNTDPSERQLQYAVWMLERGIDLMAPGVETLSFLINFADRAKNPALGQARQMLNILQNHYPERLGRGLIINLPYLVNIFFKAIMPFVDPVTRAKVAFNPDVISAGYFDKSQVTKDWGGEIEFAYNHEVTWPALVELTSKRRAEQKARWKELGGRVGLSEWDIKGGAGLSQPAVSADPAEKAVVEVEKAEVQKADVEKVELEKEDSGVVNSSPLIKPEISVTPAEGPVVAVV